MNSTGLAKPHALSCVPDRARREIRAMLRAAGWSGDVEAVVLAVHEAVMNAHQHAGGCTGVRAAIGGAEVVVEVWDSGPGFDTERYAARRPSTLAERGRGIWLISQIAASYETEHADGQTCFRLRFHS